MQKICIVFLLFGISPFVRAQKVNSRGEYMVKTAIVESYGGRDFSYKLDFEYDISNDLVKVTRSGYHGNDKYVHVYTFRSGKYSDEKYIYYTGYKNGKVFDTNKNKPLCWLEKTYYSLERKSYNRFLWLKKKRMAMMAFVKRLIIYIVTENYKQFIEGQTVLVTMK